MCFVGQRVHAGCIDPPIVEVEQRTDGDREVQLLVGPLLGAQRLQVISGDPGRIVVDPVDEPEQRFMAIVETRSLEIEQDLVDQRFVLEQFRRDRGV